MFLSSMMGSENISFPDVCDTYEGTLVTPMTYPNMSQDTLAVPASYTVLYDFMPGINQTSIPSTSEGDEAGILLGVVSFLESGPTENVLGSITTFTTCMPAMKWLSVTSQNGVNAVGANLIPIQFTTMSLT